MQKDLRPIKKAKNAGFKGIMMNLWIKTGLLLSVFLYSLPSVGEPCNSKLLPHELYEKLEKEDYAGAEAEAMKAVDNSPDIKAAQLNLAKVYINSAMRPVVNFNFSAMGIDPNKTGTPQKIDIATLEKGASDDYAVDIGFGKKAEKQINAVLRRWPESQSLLYCLTTIKFYSRDHDDFLKTLYRTAVTFSGEEEEAVGYFLGYGQYYLKHQEMEKAEEVYTTLLKVFPNNAPLLSSLGATYMYRGRAMESVPLFDKAYKQAPEDKIVIGNIAEVSMLTGDFDKAEKFLRLRAKMTPDDTSVYFDLAMNAMHIGPENSLPYWEVYFDKNKVHPDGTQWSHAAAVIRQSIKDGSLTIEEQINLADQLIEGFHTPKYAVPLMSYLQKQYKDDAAFSYQLSHAYDSGEYYDLEEKALLETYKRLQKKPSKYMEVSLNEIVYNLSRTNYIKGSYTDSLKYLDKIQKNEEEMANTGYLYGLIYIKLGKMEKARNKLLLCSKAATSSSLQQSCKQQLEKL